MSLFHQASIENALSAAHVCLTVTKTGASAVSRVIGRNLSFAVMIADGSLDVFGIGHGRVAVNYHGSNSNNLHELRTYLEGQRYMCVTDTHLRRVTVTGRRGA